MGSGKGSKMRKLANVFLAFVILGLLLRLAAVAEEAKGAAVPPETRINAEPFAVECTAYCDEGVTASGKPTTEGRTIAGAREWLGCVALLYEVDGQGGVGDFIGMYEFTDTGCGRDGDIPRGETVDIFMEDYDRCMEWGRREVYVQIIRGQG